MEHEAGIRAANAPRPAHREVEGRDEQIAQRTTRVSRRMTRGNRRTILGAGDVHATMLLREMEMDAGMPMREEVARSVSSATRWGMDG